MALRLNGYVTLPKPAALAVEAIAIALARTVDAEGAACQSHGQSVETADAAFQNVHEHLASARVFIEAALWAMMGIESAAAREAHGIGDGHEGDAR